LSGSDMFSMLSTTLTYYQRSSILDAGAAHNRADDLTAGGDNHEVGVCAGLHYALPGHEFAPLLARGYARHARGVQGRQAYRVFEVPVGEFHYVRDGAAESQDAARQRAVAGAAVALDLKFKRTQAVAAVSHAGGAEP